LATNGCISRAFRLIKILFLSRLANLFLGVFLIALIAWWAYRLWGGWAASLAVASGSLEPNFVAHSGLVTTDVGVTLFILLTVYLLWEYVSRLHVSCYWRRGRRE
jgi:4-amino-4-deoxy-L-arabinose transferase-like glycosyltransferase